MVTSDLGRVTTSGAKLGHRQLNCGDVRSRTSYNFDVSRPSALQAIVVTSDLGRVTTKSHSNLELEGYDCGDVRSRTSYNIIVNKYKSSAHIVVTSDLGRVTTL